MDDLRAGGKSRISPRKQRILGALACSKPPGLILQNELRHTVLRMEREAGTASALIDFNRSFNRTISDYGAPHFSQFILSVKDNAELTAGIAARFGMWQLVEKGYVSELPSTDECAVVVGNSSFSVLATLVGRTSALLYSGEFERVGLVSIDEPITLDAAALRQLSKVQWTLYRVGDGQKLTRMAGDIPVRELNSLPEVAVREDGTEQCLKRRQNHYLFDL